MDEKLFIKENALFWKELENKVKILSKMSRLKKLNKKEIDELIILYNQISNNLAYSRTNYGNSEITQYLNKLAASAHVIIYSSSKLQIKDFFYFIGVGFPCLFRKHLKVFIISTLIFILSGFFVFVLTSINQENAYAFIPAQMADNLRNEGNIEEGNKLIQSVFIGTNNIKACFTAFALGITLGVGTIYVLYTNGVMLGCLAGITLNKGQAAFFWSLILPHGISELFAIFVCGAAGLIIGYSLINPGNLTRGQSLIKNGREAVLLVIGCIPILIVSAIIEGYFTPLNISYIYKYMFSVMMLILVVLYIALPGRKAKPSTNLVL